MIDSSIVINNKKRQNDLGKMCIVYGLDESDLFPYIHEYKMDKPQLFSDKKGKSKKPTRESVDSIHNLFRKRGYHASI